MRMKDVKKRRRVCVCAHQCKDVPREEQNNTLLALNFPSLFCVHFISFLSYLLHTSPVDSFVYIVMISL